jgi:DNA-binding XRE family transcriptional regulator
VRLAKKDKAVLSRISVSVPSTLAIPRYLEEVFPEVVDFDESEREGSFYDLGVTLADIVERAHRPFQDIVAEKMGVPQSRFIVGSVPLFVRAGTAGAQRHEVIELEHTTINLAGNGPEFETALRCLKECQEVTQGKKFLMVPSSKGYYEASFALAKPGRFSEAAKRDDGRIGGLDFPSFMFDDGDMTFEASIRPDAKVDMPRIYTGEGIEELHRWLVRVRANMDELTNDLGDMLMIETMRMNQQGAIQFFVDKAYEYRAIRGRLNGEGRRGGFTQEKRMRIHDALMPWTGVHFKFSVPIPKDLTRVHPDIRDRINPKDTHFKIDEYFYSYMGKTEAARLDPITGHEKYSRLLWVDLIPGAAWALAKLYPQQTEVLLKANLGLDPHNQAVEKRLGRWLSYMWRINWRRAEPQTYVVRTLVEAAGIHETARYETDGMKKNRLDQALETLTEIGVINGWQYITDSWTDRAASPMDRRVVIEAPDSVRDVYGRIGKPETLKLQGGGMVLTPGQSEKGLGERLKEWRTARRMTQLQVAEKLEVSRGRVSQIEGGLKPPSSALARKIRELIRNSDQKATK